MKIKCNDGIVRVFIISKLDNITDKLMESYCLNCGKEFGVHDTKILKPEFKNHICELVKKD